jgi:tRNA pseudouridine32 synthase/23S rRNA pseudouridine746 synthase
LAPEAAGGSGAPLRILHEDGALVAVDKPAGLPVIAARGEPPEDCVQRRLERQLGRRVFVVHRIDRDASGILLFALDAVAHRAASLAFERRQVRKQYLAFVAGALSPSAGRLETALHAARRGKTRPARPGEAGAQASLTEYATHRLWRLGDRALSLVEARPHTGRHHQIRVHLRAAGAPILFDPLYGRGLMPPGLEDTPCQRLALHALRLELAGGSPAHLVVEAPLAPELEALRAWLDRRAPSGNRAAAAVDSAGLEDDPR